MPKFTVQELGPKTWPEFARVVSKHNGVWGGCWCVAFHRKSEEDWSTRTAAQNRALKERLVMAGQTHAALVFDGVRAVGWCQFGPPAELPGRITTYAKLGVELPDWRIPCFFVDRNARRQGVAKAALAGALKMIAERGGGTVDGYPLSVGKREYGSSFMWGGTETMFVDAGFQRVARLGKTKVMVRRKVRKARARNGV